LFYPHSYQSIPLLSETPGNNSVLLKYATTHATADQGTVHELRPRLFPHFVVNSLPLRSNSAPFRVTLLPLHTSLTNVQSSTFIKKRRVVVVGIGGSENGGRKVIVKEDDSIGICNTGCNVRLEPCFLTWSCTLPLSTTGTGCISLSSSSIQHRASVTKMILSRTSAASSHGREKGYIEILKGPPGKLNLVICHNLTTSSKTSSFMLNSKSASGKDNSADG